MQNHKNGTGRYSQKSGREKLRSFWKGLGDFSWVIISTVLTVGLIVAMALFMGTSGSTQQSLVKMAITDKFDMFMTNQISDAAGDLLSIEKVYWLNDDDQVAPEPDPACYGETDDPSTLGWLLEEAAELLDGQETLFSTETQIMEGSTVRYYLDETIFAIVWKEAHTNTVYTHAEVKIAHPSQLRRFLAGGEYGSEKQFITTEMAQSVNAVLASSGDFYRFRSYGIIVYDGQVKRVNGEYVDTCMIDENGDMHLIYAGQITDQAAAQKYVDENNIRFSLAFGPVIIDGGKKVAPYDYTLGEVHAYFPRAALCQMGELHYAVVVCNEEGPYKFKPTMGMFADHIAKMGFDKAYALDGGQTAVIAMDGELINAVHFGYQREISDIFYFATAVPDGG